MQKIFNNIYIYRLNKITGLFLMLSLVGAMGVIFSARSAYAADGIDYNVNVNTSLNVTLSTENVSLTLNPGTTPFASTDLNVSVGTNNPWGYKLYMDAETTDLTNNTYADPAYINTLSSTVTESNFSVNKWGYRISSLTDGNTADSDITDTTGKNFYPFVSGKLIGSATTSVNDSTSVLTFGAKVDYEKPAGVYTLDFSFRAVPKITTLSMQNLDPTVCTSDPTIVTDSRDGQSYAIARLADGKCWMLQNLKLGAKTDSLTLTTADSNVESSFTLDNKLPDGKMPYKTIDKDPVTGDKSYYWDGSAYYCTDAYGCYYNNYTATAGSMTSATGAGVTVDYSICPAGWTLPTGGEGGDFKTMVTAYGYGTDPAATVASKLLVANPATATENINGQYAPGILLGGNYGSGGANNVGAYGLYWSRTSYSTGHGYGLSVNTSGVNPLNYGNKYGGRSVRCLLQ